MIFGQMTKKSTNIHSYYSHRIILMRKLGSFKIQRYAGIPPLMFLTRPKTYEKLVRTRKIIFRRFDTCLGQNTIPGSQAVSEKLVG